MDLASELAGCCRDCVVARGRRARAQGRTSEPAHSEESECMTHKIPSGLTDSCMHKEHATKEHMCQEQQMPV